jgi:hypothetical protein
MLGSVAAGIGATTTPPQLTVVEDGSTTTTVEPISQPTVPADATAIPF